MALRLAYRRYRLPFLAPVRTAHGHWAEREGLYLRAESEAGDVSYAEVSPVPHFGRETLDEDEALLTKLGGTWDPEHLGHLPAHAGALIGALRSLVAPVAMPDTAKPLGVAALLPSGRAALTRVTALRDSGFRVFKWKVGVGDPADEQAMLDDLCGHLPTGARLRLDANGAWERRVAERWLSLAADRPVEFIEQPIGPEHRSADDLLMGLATDFPTPIGLDESLVGESDVDRWLDRGWPGVFVLKVSLVADPEAALKRLAAAKATVVFSSALETGLGARAALHTAFSWGGKPMALGFGVWPLFKDSSWDGPHLAPFLRPEDIAPLAPEARWVSLG